MKNLYFFNQTPPPADPPAAPPEPKPEKAVDPEQLVSLGYNKAEEKFRKSMERIFGTHRLDEIENNWKKLKEPDGKPAKEELAEVMKVVENLKKENDGLKNTYRRETRKNQLSGLIATLNLKWANPTHAPDLVINHYMDNYEEVDGFVYRKSHDGKQIPEFTKDKTRQAKTEDILLSLIEGEFAGLATTPVNINHNHSPVNTGRENYLAKTEDLQNPEFVRAARASGQWIAAISKQPIDIEQINKIMGRK
jgi:hypothetical protein